MQFDVVAELLFLQANIDIGVLTGVLSNIDDYKSAMEKLFDPQRPISAFWDRQPPEGRLHIIVEIPTPPTGTSRWNMFWP